jgi:hypothetical protein
MLSNSLRENVLYVAAFLYPNRIRIRMLAPSRRHVRGARGSLHSLLPCTQGTGALNGLAPNHGHLRAHGSDCGERCADREARVSGRGFEWRRPGTWMVAALARCCSWSWAGRSGTRSRCWRPTSSTPTRCESARLLLPRPVFIHFCSQLPAWRLSINVISPVRAELTRLGVRVDTVNFHWLCSFEVWSGVG